MPLAASLIATALYLVPVVIVLVARAGGADGPRRLAVDVPFAVAVDLLIILLLARFARLDAAVVASRVLWGAGAIVLGWHRLRRFRRARPVRPGPGIARSAIAALVGAVLVGVVLSLWRSRPYAIWDRQWHMPLVASLRGQAIPFVNVYQPGLRLGYHLAGDVLAATLQVLSGASLHASAALSLAHDLLFGLTALCVAALLAPERAGRWWWLVAIAPLGVLLAGPLPVVNANGYSYLNNYEMSFRPHVVLAGLLITGITASVLITVGRASHSLGMLGPVLAMLALLAITDEPSAAMLIVPLTLLVIGGRRQLTGRLPWPAVALSFSAVVALALIAFPSTLGGPRVPLVIGAPHLPSLYAPTLPLRSLRAFAFLVGDTLSMLMVIAVLGVRFGHRRSRDRGVALGFGVVVLALGCLLLTTVVVAGSPGESHRFMTLPSVVLPLLALVALTSGGWPGRGVLALALVVGAVSTVEWSIEARSFLPSFAPERYAEGIREVDCRTTTGARLFEPAHPTYVPVGDFYLWAGCRPVLAPGRSAGRGLIVDVGRPLAGKEALGVLSAGFVAPDQDLTVACPDTAVRDPVCRFGLSRGGCQRAGDRWWTCALSASDRAALLATGR